MFVDIDQSLFASIVPPPLGPPNAPPCAKLAIFEAYPNLIQNCNNFDKTATGPIIAFEIFIIIGTIVALWLLSRLENKIWQRYLVVASGVFLFEFFTSPMWNNYNLGQWAYVYQDVSWVLTIGWSTLILSTIILVDKFFAKRHRWQRFSLYLIFLAIIVLFTEAVVVKLGIRSYAPEVRAVFLGPTIMNVHIEVFYYVPVFMALVISFYKYWHLILDDELVAPAKKRRWLGSLALAVVGILLFGDSVWEPLSSALTHLIANCIAHRTPQTTR